MNNNASVQKNLWAQWAALLFGLTLLAGAAFADPLVETREVLFTNTDNPDLVAIAAQLQTPVAIYEYVRNTHEYALYQGSRSNSINTFLGQRGSDVDIASVLIAMYRSQSIPARYAVATVSIPASSVINWLGVKNVNLAVLIMGDQGIQKVQLTTDASGTQVIQFEHTWVQAQLPYDNYRGANIPAPAVNCTATPSRCHWIDLDPSFKLRQYTNAAIDVYNAVNFDYTAYYNAIKNKSSSTTYLDKNPAEIYQNLILSYLQMNYPGKTLDDVKDPGTIILVHDGILPASLPYQVVSAVKTYDAIVDHDADTSNIGLGEVREHDHQHDNGRGYS